MKVPVSHTMKGIVALLILCAHVAIGQVTFYQDVPYQSMAGVDDDLLSLDVYVPSSSEPMPIAIYIHGGGWVIGDKSNVHEKANLLTGLGYMFVSVNYRLSPFPYELENPDRIMYPDHPSDVARAIAFVLDRAENYGGDTDEVFLFGHSTGAHLVATVLSDESFLQAHGHEPSDIRCACMMDTGGYELESWITEKATDPDLFKNAFGSDPDLWREASPQLQLTDTGSMPELLLIYQDNPNRIVANQNYATAVRQTTDAIVEEFSTTYDHHELNQLLGATESAQSTAYTQSFVDWLSGCMSASTRTQDQEDSLPEIKLTFDATTKSLFIHDELRVTIYDVTGQSLLHYQGYKGEVVYLSQLVMGTYYVVEDGGARIHTIVVVE